MAAPSSRSISGEVRGKPLKEPPAVTRKEAAPRAATAAVASRARAAKSSAHFVRAREVGHPEQVAQPPLGFRPGHVVGQIDAQPSGQHVDLAPRSARSRRR
jgi:hypothetical protein